MAYKPVENKQSFEIVTFDGGLNTKFTDFNTPPNQTPSCQNVLFDDYGAVSTCKGYASYAASLGSYSVDIHSYVNNSSTRVMIAKCGSDLYYDAGGGAFTAIASSVSVFSRGYPANFLTVNNKVFVCDGQAYPYSWDGTTFRRVGVSAPSYAASATCLATGVLTGSYRYVMTGTNVDSVEGEYGLITTYCTVASGAITLTNIPEFPTSWAVSTKNIYRNKSDQLAAYYLVTSVTNTVSSVYDNSADGSLVTGAPDDNAPAPIVKFMVQNRGRVFGAGNSTYPMRLYFSNSGEPEVWPVTNYIDIGSGDGEKISGLSIFGNSLFVHKNDGKNHGSIWIVNMPDSSDVTSAANWYVSKVAVGDGAVSHRTILLFEGLMFFLNRYGAFAFNGSDMAISPAYSQAGQFGVKQISYNIEPDIFDCLTSLIDDSAAIAHENKIWMALPTTQSATENNKIYIYDYLRSSSGGNPLSGAWSVLSAPKVSGFIVHDGDLYAGASDDTGLIYKLNTTTSFNGGAIDSYFYTIWLTGNKGHEDYSKVWRTLWLWVETSGAWNLTMSYAVDFMSEFTDVSIDLTSGGNTWDQTLIWDTSTWGGGVNKKRVRVVLGKVGRAIQFRFRTNTADNWFKIYNANIEYNLRSRR